MNWYLLQAGTNHLNFGYESSGYETSVGTKRRDYSFKRKLSQWSNLSPSALKLPNETEVFLLLYQRSQNGIHLMTECCSFAYWYTAHYLVPFARSLIFWDNLFHWLPERTACDAVKDSLQYIIVGLAALLTPTFVFLIVGYEAQFYEMNNGFIATNFSGMYDAEKTVLVFLSSWMHRNRYKRWKGACTDL